MHSALSALLSSRGTPAPEVRLWSAFADPRLGLALPDPHSPFPFQSCPFRGGSSLGWLSRQAAHTGLLVSLPIPLPHILDMEMQSGTPILLFFSTRLNQYFWEMMTQGRATLESKSHSDILSGYFLLSLALEIDFQAVLYSSCSSKSSFPFL